jgi:serine/threonine protein kinase/Tfp pilus assembly protein PilF
VTDPPERELTVFSDARRLPASERAAFLEQACGGDPALRQRVETLLAANDRAGAFLQEPAAQTRVSPTSTSNAQPGASALPGFTPIEQAGCRIGRYKLLQQIGEGGCGVVYMAEQEEPVRRRVALKVIKLGMDTRNVIARFEAERQALALMDHPNIARVLEAGATDTGRPFFVMELVRGIKITNYCDQNNLSTRERLGLFVQVCRAIQHAHQKGIIHRDVKPSNILVTMHDGVPEPKVIDFGIAKATTDQRLTDKTVFTAYEQFIGTPAYMSPEQAEMTALDIDTRSDIYALGVLLYELLTGNTPFDSEQLLAAGLDEMRRTIREKEPVRPSTRLSTMLAADLTNLAQHRHSEPAKLAGILRGDLDWIVMKCLEKDRRRRYETANGLAMDIERHLKNEPVLARPPTKAYRFQRLARRNKAAFAAAAAVLAALLLGLGISTRMFFRARVEARKNRQVAGVLLQSLKSVSPDEAKGRDPATVMLERVAQSVPTDLKDQPAVAAEVLGLVGAMYYERGDYARAKEQQVAALALNQQVFGAQSTNTVDALKNLALTLWDQQNLAQAERLFRQTLALDQKLFGPQSREAALTLDDLGLVLWTRGDLPEAKTRIAEALAIEQKRLPPQDPELRQRLSNLGLVLWEQGDLAQAEANLRAAEDLSKRRTGGTIDVEASILNNLANVVLSEGRLAEAQQLYEQTWESAKNLPRDHPHSRLVRSHLAVVLRRQAALSADSALLHRALEMNPADPLTADALACRLAEPALTRLTPPEPDPSQAPTSSSGWRCTTAAPDPNWAAPDFVDAAWQSAPAVTGLSTYSPRTDRSVTTHTNFWLRREFEVTEIPKASLALLLDRCQDAEIFLNGVQAAPTADWSDCPVLVPCSNLGQTALRRGHNVLALHCQDADGATHIGVALFACQDPTLGRQQVIDELTQLLRKEPNRTELYVGRANAYARLGHWTQATADLKMAQDLARENKATAATCWQSLAPLLLESDNGPDYRKGRQGSLEPGALPDSPAMAAEACALALLVPAAGPELDSVVSLAADIATPGNAKATLTFRQTAKGLVEFRRGEFSSAIQWMQNALETGARQDLPAWTHERERNRAVAALAVQAMAYHQLKNSSEAQTALASGTRLINDQCPQLTSGDLGREWPEWLIGRILFREAATLVSGQTPAPASH